MTLTDFDADLSSAGGAGIILPSGVSDLTVTAKRDFPPVTALVFRKVNSVFRISGKGSTTFPATGFFESAYGLNVKHFSDGGDGAPVSVLSNFWNPGKFVTYKLYAEEAGIYDLTLRYANYRDDTVLSDACALFVSNVGQPIAPGPRPPYLRKGGSAPPDRRDRTRADCAPRRGMLFQAGVRHVAVPGRCELHPHPLRKTGGSEARGNFRRGASVSAGYEPSLISDDRDAPVHPSRSPMWRTAGIRWKSCSPSCPTTTLSALCPETPATRTKREFPAASALRFSVSASPRWRLPTDLSGFASTR